MLQIIISNIKKVSPKKIAIGGAVLIIVIKFLKSLKSRISSHLTNSAYKEETRKFINIRNESLAKFIKEEKDKIPKSDQQNIQHSHLLQLQKYFLEERYTSEQIITSLLLRAAEVGKENNYIADVNIEETIKLAKEADILFNAIKNNKSELDKLPLLGLPLSIKESLPVANFKTTLEASVIV